MSRSLDNPLFDKYVEAMVPYVQRHRQWHDDFVERHPDLYAEDARERLELETLTWDIGRSKTALVALTQAVREAPERMEKELHDIEALISPFAARHELVTEYSWAIPTEEALDAIERHASAGVVEIGAGTGYWARFLRARGMFVQAYDLEPHDNPQAQGRWSPVEIGGPEKAALWPKCALMLCWPPYDTPMALRSLVAYSGDTFIYIGEADGGCNGDKNFHKLVEKRWEEVEYVSLPQWPGIHDGLTVYKRI